MCVLLTFRNDGVRLIKSTIGIGRPIPDTVLPTWYQVPVPMQSLCKKAVFDLLECIWRHLVLQFVPVDLGRSFMVEAESTLDSRSASLRGERRAITNSYYCYQFRLILREKTFSFKRGQKGLEQKIQNWSRIV
jgi:hypothetical protein